MQNNIKDLEIQNFKSVKKLKLKCSRSNIFIGKPNVGKSNILEAVSLLGKHSGNKFYSDFIHYENFRNLFYDQETKESIHIKTSIGDAKIKFFPNDNVFGYFFEEQANAIYEIEKIIILHDAVKRIQDKNKSNSKYSFASINLEGLLSLSPADLNNPIRNYKFNRLQTHNDAFNEYLLPPDGKNLLTILQNNNELRYIVPDFFKEYGYDFVIEAHEQKIKIQKKKGFIYSLLYSMVADTLQRITFYLAAIKSNNDAVILFEEPETSSFPPYTKILADYISESKENQFFITTHSPYLLNSIIENPESDCSVFITNFRDYKTVAKKLTEEEIREILDYGTDVFFNLDQYGG